MKMNKIELKQAIMSTAAVTGFSPILIEKDYQCSIILKKIYENEFLTRHCIFKGGTLLAKCYLPFFRMSEDLDFSVINEICHDRKDRRKLADEIRNLIPTILSEFGFYEIVPLKGFNESRQYNAVFVYPSFFLPHEKIKFELGFRGDLLLPPERQLLQTLVRHPYQPEKSLMPVFEALVLSESEAYAEKVRAALTRTIPAIRDFYDIFAIKKRGFDLLDKSFIDLVRMKISFDNKAGISLKELKKSELKARIPTELDGVLKIGAKFSLEESWKILESIVDQGKLSSELELVSK